MLTKLLISANIIMLAFFALAFQLLPKQVPLYYSASWGEDQIADLWEIALIPAIMHAFYFANTFLTKKFVSDQEILKKIFDYATVFFIVGFTAVFLKILFLVT